MLFRLLFKIRQEAVDVAIDRTWPCLIGQDLALRLATGYVEVWMKMPSNR